MVCMCSGCGGWSGSGFLCEKCREDNLKEEIIIKRLEGKQIELLREFAKNIISEWTLQKYWDGEPCERIKDHNKLVDDFLISRKK